MLVKFARPFYLDKLYPANEIVEIDVPEGWKLPAGAVAYDEPPPVAPTPKKQSTTTLSQMAKTGAKGPLDEDE